MCRFPPRSLSPRATPSFVTVYPAQQRRAFVSPLQKDRPRCHTVSEQHRAPSRPTHIAFALRCCSELFHHRPETAIVAAPIQIRGAQHFRKAAARRHALKTAPALCNPVPAATHGRRHNSAATFHPLSHRLPDSAIRRFLGNKHGIELLRLHSIRRQCVSGLSIAATTGFVRNLPFFVCQQKISRDRIDE